MKKFTAMAIAIVFVLFSFISCEKGPLGAGAGAAQAEEMLRLLPQDVAAVFFIDVQRILTVESMDKLVNKKMEEKHSFEKNQSLMKISILKTCLFHLRDKE